MATKWLMPAKELLAGRFKEDSPVTDCLNPIFLTQRVRQWVFRCCAATPLQLGEDLA
jgi:hypothetical protein